MCLRGLFVRRANWKAQRFQDIPGTEPPKGLWAQFKGSVSALHRVHQYPVLPISSGLKSSGGASSMVGSFFPFPSSIISLVLWLKTFDGNVTFASQNRTFQQSKIASDCFTPTTLNQFVSEMATKGMSVARTYIGCWLQMSKTIFFLISMTGLVSFRRSETVHFNDQPS